MKEGRRFYEGDLVYLVQLKYMDRQSIYGVVTAVVWMVHIYVYMGERICSMLVDDDDGWYECGALKKKKECAQKIPPLGSIHSPSFSMQIFPQVRFFGGNYPRVVPGKKTHPLRGCHTASGNLYLLSRLNGSYGPVNLSLSFFLSYSLKFCTVKFFLFHLFLFIFLAFDFFLCDSKRKKKISLINWSSVDQIFTRKLFLSSLSRFFLFFYVASIIISFKKIEF